LAEEWLREEKLRIKIGCAFFVPFFAQAKKGNTYANDRYLNSYPNFRIKYVPTSIAAKSDNSFVRSTAYCLEESICECPQIEMLIQKMEAGSFLIIIKF